MTPQKPMIKLSVGEAYPIPVKGMTGARAELFRPGHSLIITMQGITPIEHRAMTRGKFFCSLLSAHGAIMLLWHFQDKKGRPVLTFDSVFDVRLIPGLKLPDIDSVESRILLDVHIADSDSGILKGLRASTMPPDLTRALTHAIHDQLSTVETGQKQIARWMQYEPYQLFESATKYQMGI